MAEERRNPVEREISTIRSSSGAGEPSSSATSSSIAVAEEETNAQEDARNNGKLFPIPEGTCVGNRENYAPTTEEKCRCCINKNKFKTKDALYGHMPPDGLERSTASHPPWQRPRQSKRS